MGAKLTKQAARSAVVRPLKNYNVEERAMKAISKEIPKVAPPHPSMKAMMDEIRRDPNLLTKAKQDPVLMDKLQHVYITSEGDNPIIKARTDLPQNRQLPEDDEFGYYEPQEVPAGKATLKQITELLGNHQRDPETFTIERLAKDYNLDEENVRDIVKHFTPFSLFTPTRKPTPSKLLKAIKGN